MPTRKRAALERDPPAVTARAAELAAQGRTQSWFLVDNDDLAAMREGRVTEAVRELAARLLEDR